MADITCQLGGIYEQYGRHVCLCGCFQRGISKQEMITFKVGDLPQCLVKIEFQGKCVLYLPPLLPKHLCLCAALTLCCAASSVFQARLHSGGPLRDLQPQTGTAEASGFKDQAAAGSSNPLLYRQLLLKYLESAKNCFVFDILILLLLFTQKPCQIQKASCRNKGFCKLVRPRE